MSAISAIADRLRQRPGETDAAWIERLRTLFAEEHAAAASPDKAGKADQVGEQLWKRHQAPRSGGI